jgi:hypothetical protein
MPFPGTRLPAFAYFNKQLFPQSVLSGKLLFLNAHAHLSISRRLCNRLFSRMNILFTPKPQAMNHHFILNNIIVFSFIYIFFMCSRNAQEAKEKTSDTKVLMGETEDPESNKKNLPE